MLANLLFVLSLDVGCSTSDEPDSYRCNPKSDTYLTKEVRTYAIIYVILSVAHLT